MKVFKNIPVTVTGFVSSKIMYKLKAENIEIQREIDYYHDILTKKAVKEIKAFSLFDYIYDKWKIRIDKYTLKEKNSALSPAR